MSSDCHREPELNASVVMSGSSCRMARKISVEISMSLARSASLSVSRIRIAWGGTVISEAFANQSQYGFVK